MARCISYVLTLIQMVELDTPKQLLANRESIFYSLVHEAGLTGTQME